MNQATLAAFEDELVKIAGLKDWWDKFLRIVHLRPNPQETAPHKTKAELMAAYHFSPKAGGDRWDKFAKYIADPDYLRVLTKNPQADEKLIRHAVAMNEMVNGQTVGKIKSSRIPGRTYEIRETPTGLACTCPDWRYKGSVNPGYECKHIGAHKEGRVSA